MSSTLRMPQCSVRKVILTFDVNTDFHLLSLSAQRWAHSFLLKRSTRSVNLEKLWMCICTMIRIVKLCYWGIVWVILAEKVRCMCFIKSTLEVLTLLMLTMVRISLTQKLIVWSIVHVRILAQTASQFRVRNIVHQCNVILITLAVSSTVCYWYAWWHGSRPEECHSRGTFVWSLLCCCCY